MKKYTLSVLVISMVLVLILTDCSQAGPAPTPTPAKSTPVPAAALLQRGGTLRVMINSLPAVFGNPRQYSGSKVPVLSCMENLATLDEKGNLVPWLATSWDVDTSNKTISIRLRQGIKFHDGTDFNAAAVKWNMEQYLAANAISGGQYIKSIEATDNYTVKLSLTQYSALSLNAYLFYGLMFSPIAIQTKGLEGSRTSPVGTGPFKFADYKRDNYLKFVKFDGYWGEPAYLDGVDISVVSDAFTASTMMQAGQADMWIGTQGGVSAKEASGLQKKGCNVVAYPGYIYTLNPDSANADSPYAKKGVREAIEHAIDRPALAKTLGYGFMLPLNQIAAPDVAGYNQNYKGRSYDPARAKQLLAAAGYPNGFKTKIIINGTSADQRDTATALQSYLSAVGIDAQVDVADAARYQSLTITITTGQGTWNNGMVLVINPIDPGDSYVDMFVRCYKPGGRYASMARSPEFVALNDKIAAAASANLRPLMEQMVRQAADDVLAIPLSTFPFPIVAQKNVHTTYGKVNSPAVWHFEKDWIEKK